MASYFALDDPRCARDYGVTACFDDDVGGVVNLDPEEIIYPCIRTMAMGFAWSLFFLPFSGGEDGG